MNDDKIRKWRSAVEASPDDEFARFTLAKACFDAGRFDEARDHFREATRMNPDWMVAHILLGRSLTALGDVSGARTALLEGRRLAEIQDHQDPVAEVDELLEELDG